MTRDSKSNGSKNALIREQGYPVKRMWSDGTCESEIFDTQTG